MQYSKSPAEKLGYFRSATCVTLSLLPLAFARERADTFTPLSLSPSGTLHLSLYLPHTQVHIYNVYSYDPDG